MTFAGALRLPWNWLANTSPRLAAGHINRARIESASYPGELIKLLDDQGRILYASDSHEPMLGFAAGVLVGLRFHEVIAPEDITHCELSIQDAVATQEATEIGFRHLRADGTFLYVRRKTYALRGDKRSRYYILTRSKPRD
jgi:PAS domain S-box-containing protein